MTNKQLTVVGDVDPNGRSAVDHLLGTGVIESAWYGHSASSTNSLALEQAESDDLLKYPRLVLTDQQTAGRGRRGRTWLSSDQTLTFSLALDSPLDSKRINLISLAVGVGVARCLEYDFAPLQVRLKWPNDVYVGGGKVAGILLETAGAPGRRVIVGVGFNVGSPPELKNSLHVAPVCSLNQATGRSLTRYDCFASLVQHVMASLNQTEDVVKEFRRRCMLTNHSIQFLHHGVEQQGLCLGIDDQGELIVDLETETVTVRSGEVQLVRQRKK